MTSPRPGGTPASRAVNASKTPATGGTPLGDDAIWKRLKESGLDEESVKRRDKAALISYITKLESEVRFFIFPWNSFSLILDVWVGTCFDVEGFWLIVWGFRRYLQI
ncbi:hypothetical protein BHE74_00003319 [Ensete ventricosum]|nr:hypothetical protein BHE74_00003319 [Ensete ventricosum]